MTQPPLMIVREWQEKSSDTSNRGKIIPVSNVPRSFPIEPKEEPIDIHESDPDFQDYQISASELMRDQKMFKEEKMNNEHSFPIEPKEEPIDIHEPLPQYYQISASELMRDEKLFKEEEMDNETTEGINSLNGAHIQNSGIYNRFGNSLNASLHNDHNYARKMERRSSGDDESLTVRYKLLALKKNETELECPECEAGLALLCECGRESLSGTHSLKCNQGNHTTVIHKRDGPIRRIYDEKATPRCVLCEDYPNTAHGYALHLYNHHSSYLAEHGIYLVCSCGLEVRCSSPNCSLKHLEDCDPRQFTLRNLNDETATPQCVLCKVYPKNARCYAVHLHVRHKTTLAEKGIYLICSCGVEVRSITGGTKHLGECNPRQFAVHRLDGQKYVQNNINRKVTPKCVLCEIYPKTASGYASHLERHHKSTLIQNGIFLLCSCGLKVRSSCGNVKHFEHCNTRQFTLHKLVDV